MSGPSFHRLRVTEVTPLDRRGRGGHLRRAPRTRRRVRLRGRTARDRASRNRWCRRPAQLFDLFQRQRRQAPDRRQTAPGGRLLDLGHDASSSRRGTGGHASRRGIRRRSATPSLRGGDRRQRDHSGAVADLDDARGRARVPMDGDLRQSVGRSGHVPRRAGRPQGSLPRPPATHPCAVARAGRHAAVHRQDR